MSTADVAELVPGRPAPARVERHDRDEDATLVAGCVVALETDNVDSLVSLLRENVAAA